MNHEISDLDIGETSQDSQKPTRLQKKCTQNLKRKKNHQKEILFQELEQISKKKTLSLILEKKLEKKYQQKNGLHSQEEINKKPYY